MGEDDLPEESDSTPSDEDEDETSELFADQVRRAEEFRRLAFPSIDALTKFHDNLLAGLIPRIQLPAEFGRMMAVSLEPYRKLAQNFAESLAPSLAEIANQI